MITYGMAKPRLAESVAHDHAVCVETALRTAAEVCARRGLKLTPVRQRILEIVWRAHDPIGAYEILAELAKERDKAAPPTVYRALEFLIEAGLVHRIDSLNAFIGCESPQRPHVAQFFVCRQCQRVLQIDEPAVSDTLAAQARERGFHIEPTTLEIKGLCEACSHSTQ